MRAIICGDRNWNDDGIICDVLNGLVRYNPTIIHGAGNGADILAAEYASFLNLTVISFPANWKEKGKAAGPIRNQQMLDEGKGDVVFAFHDDLKSSKGTRDMVLRAVKAGVPVYNIRHITSLEE